MFVAKVPGSTYATEATNAGPRKGQRPRAPRRRPASDSWAASKTRASPGRTSSRGWTGAPRSCDARPAGASTRSGASSGSTSADQEAGRPHRRDAGEVAADRPPRPEPARRGARDVPADLDDHLQRRTRRECEEERRQHVVRRVAADPGAEDRRRAGDEGQSGQLRDRHPGTRRRRRDPEPLGDVVHHEADHEERAELKLPRRKRAADRETLPEVVDADPDRDEEREREATRADLPTCEPRGEEGHAERTRREPHQDEARAAEGRRQAGLQLEGLEERLDAEEREQPAGQRHERREPRRAGASEA